MHNKTKTLRRFRRNNRRRSAAQAMQAIREREALTTDFLISIACPWPTQQQLDDDARSDDPTTVREEMH